MNKACDKAKIKRCGFHTLRKSVGAHLGMRGVQWSYVAKLLGHKSIRVAERHYGHLVEDHVAETLQASMPSFG